MIRDIDCFIFDMDGLMFDSENVCFMAESTVAEQMGFDFSREFYVKTIGSNGSVLKQMYIDTYGNNFPFEEMMRRTEIEIRTFNEKHGILIKDGLVSLLEHLKNQRKQCIVASSSSSSTIYHNLRESNLLNFFVEVVGGDEVTLTKPHPDIFLKALEKVDVNPTRCLVLEDSTNGILAAYAAGIPVACIPDMAFPTREVFDKTRMIVPTLHDLISILGG